MRPLVLTSETVFNFVWVSVSVCVCDAFPSIDCCCCWVAFCLVVKGKSNFPSFCILCVSCEQCVCVCVSASCTTNRLSSDNSIGIGIGIGIIALALALALLLLLSSSRCRLPANWLTPKIDQSITLLATHAKYVPRNDVLQQQQQLTDCDWDWLLLLLLPCKDANDGLDAVLCKLCAEQSPQLNICSSSSNSSRSSSTATWLAVRLICVHVWGCRQMAARLMKLWLYNCRCHCCYNALKHCTNGQSVQQRKQATLETAEKLNKVGTGQYFDIVFACSWTNGSQIKICKKLTTWLSLTVTCFFFTIL